MFLNNGQFPIEIYPEGFTIYDLEADDDGYCSPEDLGWFAWPCFVPVGVDGGKGPFTWDAEEETWRMTLIRSRPLAPTLPLGAMLFWWETL